MRKIISYLLNIAMLAFFAFISVYVPRDMYFLVTLIYLIAFLAINFVIVGISAKRLFKDLVYVSEGKTIFEETKKTIQTLQKKDKLLVQESKVELKSYAKSILVTVLMFIIMMLIVYVPQIRELIISIPKDLFLACFKDEKISLFFSNIVFYLILMLMFMSISKSLGGGKVMETMVIPSYYKITKRGLLIEERLAYKFPLKVKQVNKNTSRKYVELIISGTPTFKQSGVTSKIRLYTNRVEELYKILKANVEIE